MLVAVQDTVSNALIYLFGCEMYNFLRTTYNFLFYVGIAGLVMCGISAIFTDSARNPFVRFSFVWGMRPKQKNTTEEESVLVDAKHTKIAVDVENEGLVANFYRFVMWAVGIGLINVLSFSIILCFCYYVSFTGAVFIYDVLRIMIIAIMNTVLACAGMERMTAVFGAVVGGGVGILWFGSQDTLSLIVCMVLGALFGAGAYMFRTWRVGKSKDGSPYFSFSVGSTFAQPT